MDEEIRIHLEMRVEELVSQGVPADDARREALRKFGDVEGTRPYCLRQDERKEIAVQHALMLQDLGRDVRTSLRSLLRAPILALTILVTVGLGIGATTVMFSAIDVAFFRPLPYADADPRSLTRRVEANGRPTAASLYVAYYHTFRTHPGLAKDAPIFRPVQPPSAGAIVEVAHVGGLHHHDERRAA